MTDFNYELDVEDDIGDIETQRDDYFNKILSEYNSELYSDKILSTEDIIKLYPTLFLENESDNDSDSDIIEVNTKKTTTTNYSDDTDTNRKKTIINKNCSTNSSINIQTQGDLKMYIGYDINYDMSNVIRKDIKGNIKGNKKADIKDKKENSVIYNVENLVSDTSLMSFNMSDTMESSENKSDEVIKKRGRPKGSMGKKKDIVEIPIQIEHCNSYSLDELNDMNLKTLLDIGKSRNIKSLTGKRKNEVIRILMENKQ